MHQRIDCLFQSCTSTNTRTNFTSQYNIYSYCVYNTVNSSCHTYINKQFEHCVKKGKKKQFQRVEWEKKTICNNIGRIFFFFQVSSHTLSRRSLEGFNDVYFLYLIFFFSRSRSYIFSLCVNVQEKAHENVYIGKRGVSFK